ncbi:MAG TPA: BMP family ABC transporter substrate-binding protein [Firmicutes bacterium]|nr:BMP family ABC transporter substrate-binding protein [Bacillota bacterium]
MTSVLALVVAISLTLAGCGGGPAAGDQGKAPEQGKEKKFRVAYVISGNLGDKSFFDSGMAGMERVQKELGAEIKVIQSVNSADWEPNLESAAQDGYDVVVAAASQMHDAIQNVAPKYPKVKFVYIDDVVKGDNIASITFAQNEGSFLAGALAALMTTHTELPGMNKEKIIGWVGGSDIAVLHDFLTGYEQGAKYIDPQVKVLSSFAGSFNDPAKGKELTLAQYNQGADIVMNVASGTGVGILEAAKDAGKYAIGVDSDQDGIYPGHILTSMLKRVDNAVFDQVKLAKEGQWKAGHFEYGLQNQGVGLTDMKVMGDKIPQEVRQKLADITAKVAKGEIKVDHYANFKVGQ